MYSWEQRKLSEVTTCFDNLRVPVTASDRVPGKIPYYGANGIQDYVSGYTHSGEFVLIAEDGANDLNDYPIQYVNGAIWVNNHAHVIAGYKEKLENKFLSYSLKTVKMSTFIVGGGRSKLNLKALLEISISMPNYDEQCCIGKFIETIDKTITLHQRKLEKLKLTKKALLQKLFPQNGSKFPELRFKGFTAAWEQCKLSDITEIVMGQSPSSKNYTDNPNDNILVQGNADLKDGKVVPRLWTKEITKTIDKDGIVLTVRAPVGDVAKTDYKVVLGRGVAGIKGNDYIYQFLQKLQNNRYWVSLSSGSTFESINSNDIKDLIIDIPSIEEQTKISMLLNNVNSIITLHQRKLEMLKNVKKGLLQKMFV